MKKYRTLVILLPKYMGKYAVVAYYRTSAKGHVGLKVLGSYKDKALAKSKLARARVLMKKKKGTDVGFVDASSRSERTVPLLIERGLAPLRAKRSRRDVSREDLRHLSTGALLKMLRQADRKGDEDMAEAIGKELDRRSKF